MDQESILDRLSQISDLGERTALLDTYCGNDTRKRQALLEQLGRRNLSVNRDDLPTKPPIQGGATKGPSDLLGQKLGRYEIIKTLGEGGMGVVYLAQQEHPVKRQVAIKVTKPEYQSVELTNRFRAERQALALMDHENIAKVFDAGSTDDGRLYFAMELVNGVPINQYCEEKALSTNKRLELLTSVCRAIQHAHQKGIVHRDIKPSNVLIVEAEGKAVPKVIDFGLAKALEQQLTPNTLHTQVGQVMGTLEYMSPEQASFKSVDVDTRSDVYSLGVLLYELLIGTTPLGRNRLKELEFDELLKVIREEEASRPSIRRSEIHSASTNSKSFRGDLDLITLKALAKDRERRYQSPAALADDIERFLNDEPIEARAPSAIYLMRKFARRNRALVGGIAAVMAATVLGISASTYFAISASQAAKRAEQETQRAQDQRDIALDTLEDVIFQLSAPLSKIPAAREVRQEMVNCAIGGLQRMSESFEDDWASSRTMMIAMEDIGDMFLQLGPSADSELQMDHREVAKEQFLRAEKIALNHLDEWPDDHQVNFDAYIVYDRLSMVEASLDQLEQAVAYRLKATELIEKLADQDPARYLEQYFNCCFGLSGISFVSGDLESALHWTKKSLELVEQVADTGIELKQPIDAATVEELELRAQVFAKLPTVYDDPKLALDEPPQLRNRLLIDRAKYYVERHDVAEVEHSLEIMLEAGDLAPSDYYSAACRYARCASIILDGGSAADLEVVKRTQFDGFCNEAMSFLHECKDAGYFATLYEAQSILNRDPDLDSLRDREDFKAFVADLK